METYLDELRARMGESEHGNSTAIDIGAPPQVAWRALHELRLRDLRLTAALSAVRSAPGRMLRRGALDSASGDDLPLLESMRRGRMTILANEPEGYLALGLIGQFWKLDGGTDVNVEDTAGFIAFDSPGYVKALIDFRATETAAGCRLVTDTHCWSTDEAAAKLFRRYWLLIGWGSKAIRWDLLRATRRRASSDPGGHAEKP